MAHSKACWLVSKVFVYFLEYFDLLVSSFTPQWSEDTQEMISVVLKFVESRFVTYNVINFGEDSMY